MKVKIGKFTTWLGPYQLAEKLCFWAKPVTDENGFKEKPEWVHTFGEWLAHGHIEKKGKIFKLSRNERHETLLYKLLQWIESKKKRKVKIQIDPWDTWNMDGTLSMIILPMLKQLKATKHGSPMVEDKDVPKGLGLRSTEADEKENDWDSDSNIHERWDWVMDELIWTFEQLNDEDNDAQFHTGEHDIYFEKVEGETYSEMKTGPKDTHVFDKKGYKAHQKRIAKGLVLFGKYYQGLWD